MGLVDGVGRGRGLEGWPGLRWTGGAGGSSRVGRGGEAHAKAPPVAGDGADSTGGWLRGGKYLAGGGRSTLSRWISIQRLEKSIDFN